MKKSNRATQKLKNKTYSLLSTMLDYNRVTGVLTWKSGHGGRYEGKSAGYIHDKNIGYRKIKYNNKRYLCHRVAWVICYGKLPDNQIDHIDGDRDNNSLVNLRDVSQTINARNVKGKSKPHIAIAGVRFVSNSWDVTCCSEWLGRFSCLGKAVKVRKAKERELGGFTKRHSLR